MANELHLCLERDWYSLFDLHYLGHGVPILTVQMRASRLVAFNMARQKTTVPNLLTLMTGPAIPHL